jgi:hypothetical protein
MAELQELFRAGISEFDRPEAVIEIMLRKRQFALFEGEQKCSGRRLPGAIFEMLSA